MQEAGLLLLSSRLGRIADQLCVMLHPGRLFGRVREGLSFV